MLNRIVRIFLLTACALALLIYLIGFAANMLGWMDLRPSDEVVEEAYRPVTEGDSVLRYIEFPQGQIGYIVAYKTGGKTDAAIFYVHGSPGSLDANGVYLHDPHLRSHAIQYTYDRPGYGASKKWGAEKKLEVQAACLKRLIEHAGMSRNIVVGHSLGCSIAAACAADYPDLVDGLVLVAPPLDPELEPASWWRPILNFPVISMGIPKALRVSNTELHSLKKDLKAYRPKWKNITCPVTVIQGLEDRLVPAENIAFAIKEFTGSEKMRAVPLDGADHFIYWSRETLIADEIIRLVDPTESE